MTDKEKILLWLDMQINARENSTIYVKGEKIKNLDDTTPFGIQITGVTTVAEVLGDQVCIYPNFMPSSNGKNYTRVSLATKYKGYDIYELVETD